MHTFENHVNPQDDDLARPWDVEGGEEDRKRVQSAKKKRKKKHKKKKRKSPAEATRTEISASDFGNDAQKEDNFDLEIGGTIVTTKAGAGMSSSSSNFGDFDSSFENLEISSSSNYGNFDASFENLEKSGTFSHRSASTAGTGTMSSSSNYRGFNASSDGFTLVEPKLSLVEEDCSYHSPQRNNGGLDIWSGKYEIETQHQPRNVTQASKENEILSPHNNSSMNDHHRLPPITPETSHETRKVLPPPTTTTSMQYRESDHDSGFCCCKTRIQFIGAFLLLGVIVGFVCFIVIGKPFSPEVGNDNSITDGSTSNGHTSGSGLDVESYMELLAPLSDPASLRDPSSPQRQAIEWLAKTDTFTSTPSLESVTQRYSLTALFHALTYGEESAVFLDWLNPNAHECTWWPGLTCNDQRVVTEVNLNNMGMVGAIAPEVNHLSGLLKLSLSNNTLVGTLPDVSQLTLLEHLEVERAALSGSIPSSIGDLAKLTTLDLSHNFLSAALPQEIYQLTSVQVFDIAFNRLEGEFSDSFENFSQIRILNIRNNRITGSIPDILPSMTELLDLIIDYNLITGTIPKVYDFLGKRREMSGSHNFLTGVIHPDTPTGEEAVAAFDALLNGLYGLTTANLASNLLTGTIPDNMPVLPALELIDFSDNLLTGSVLGFFAAPAKYINFNNNHLDGSLPKSYGSQLEYIGYGGNDLKGTIPTKLGTLTNLNHLDLSSNKNISGTIPFQLSRATNLRYLNVQNASLTGQIPQELLTSLGNLEWLLLNDNQLSGALPENVFDFHLERLNLSSNNLTGSIPSTWSRLTNLHHAELQNNLLQGVWPLCGERAFLRDAKELNFTLGCEVTCSCCNPCVQ